MKRKPEESFEEYRERRKKENNWKQRIRIFFTGGTYRRKPEEKIVREKPVSPAIGKRHKGESLADFKVRRKACNQRRRIREMANG